MNDAPKHTCVGCGLFHWPPYQNLRRASADAAHLWQVFYMGRRAKTLLPGLWVGGLYAMADDSAMTLDETQSALRVAVEQEMAEYDQVAGVLRLTKLPDRCEAGKNQSILLSWWTKFERDVPACGVRDRYLDLIDWLHPRPFKAQKTAKGGASTDMLMVWEATFGAALKARSAPPTYPQSDLSIPKASSPLQLDLYATPEKTHGGGHGGGHDQGKGLGKGKEKAEGEVQEREPPTAPGTGRTVPVSDLAGRCPHAPHPGTAFADTCDECLAERREHGAAGPLDLLRLAKQTLAGMVGEKLYELWVDPLGGTQEGDVLHLTAPSTFHRDRIRDHYREKLQAALRQSTGRAVQIAI